jgi:hypothetical protein
VTEQARPGGAVLEQGEVQEWVDPVGEEWVAPERVQVQKESVYALNVARLSPMKRESLATTGNVPNVGRRW